MLWRILLTSALAFAFVTPALAHHLRFTANLTGPAESPANSSPGLGHVVVTLDLDLAVMEIETTFNGLQETVTATNIRAPTLVAGSGTADVATQVPTFTGFPSGVSSGAYDHEFDLAEASTYNPAFITATGGTISTAMNALIFALDDGKAYFNLHTTAYGGGEIRGFLSHVAGDYNDNGVVDAADYVVWRRTRGETGEGLKADSNNDNVINDDDYMAWRENFGHAGLSSGSATAAISPEIVPEPTPFLLWLATCVVFLLRRTR